MSIEIEGRKIGSDAPPFIIAEMSGNHNQSLDRALKIVEEIAASGAHALKLQTYTADTMTIDVSEGEFYIDNDKSPWKGHNLYELYEKAHTPWEWHEQIFKKARELGLIAFSTPFDATAVDFLETLDVPFYKIASFENTDLPLIRKVCSTGKPVIISTGLASIAEIDEAVKTARDAGCRDLILMKCTSNYPASSASSNLATIPHMKALFKCEVGLSDHTLGIGAAVASVALGATVIEKHFTLSREEGGVDADFSLEPSEFKSLVQETETAWQSIGQVQIGPSDEEIPSKIFRRSLYVCEDIQAGERFTEKNLRSIRPGYGLPVKYQVHLLGKKSNASLTKGTPLSWDLVNGE